MARKDIVIKHLKMMGYSVGEDIDSNDFHIISVCLITNDAQVYMVHAYPEELQKDFAIETLVGKINKLIKDDK